MAVLENAIDIARSPLEVFDYCSDLCNEREWSPGYVKDVQRLTDEARAKRIPVTTITETLAPATATFEAWQVAQLKALAAALAKATGH